MDREVFAARFREAAVYSRDFATQFLEEELPATLRFRLRLNYSYDGNPLHTDEIFFPEDSSLERSRQVRDCGADDVIATLWRDGRVPEWVNLNVVGVTAAATIIEILACGRFTANENLLYHIHAGRPPFQVGGPTLPNDWVEGLRFSIFHHARCSSRTELEAMRPHARKVWSLDLEGAIATDETLQALPDLPDVTILEMTDSALRGPGLLALARFPKLWILRVAGVADDLNVSDGPPLKRLEELTISGLPSRPWGLNGWLDRLSALDTLSLTASGDLYFGGALPTRLGNLTLTAPKLAGDGRLPKRVTSISLHLAEQKADALEAMLAPVRGVNSLSLRGTPVDESFVAKLMSRWKLRYLDVVDTSVSEGFLRQLKAQQPALKFYPRVD